VQDDVHGGGRGWWSGADSDAISFRSSAAVSTKDRAGDAADTGAEACGCAGTTAGRGVRARATGGHVRARAADGGELCATSRRQLRATSRRVVSDSWGAAH
jgi:hypothetical protein